MTESDQRQAVVAEARSWVGTRYRSSGRIKGVGVDCVQIIAAVYEAAGVKPPMDVGKYSDQWHLHSDVPLYEDGIKANGGRQIESPQPGDLALYFQGKQFAHGAIVTVPNPLRFVHAFAPARMVVEGDETEFGVLVNVKKKFFTPW